MSLLRMHLSEKYTIEDLLANESFLNFYFQKNEDDVLDWEEWRDAGPENAALAARAFGLLDQLSLRWGPDQIRRHWLELHGQIGRPATEAQPAATGAGPRLFWSRRRWAAVAASFLVCAFAGWGWWAAQQPEGPMALANEHPNRLMIFTLPDGTKLHVKPHSRVLLSKDFGKDDRELHLTGEAMFVVAHDPARPFRVRTAGLSVTALGTTFNVRAIDDEEETRVVLTEGKIKVEAPYAAAVLGPGEEITYQNREKRLATKRKLSPPSEPGGPRSEIRSALQAGSWVQFNQTPFADVATSLEHTFNIRFAGINPELAALPVSYQFRGDQPLKKILNDLSIRCGCSFRTDGATVHIEPSPPNFEHPGE